MYKKLLIAFLLLCTIGLVSSARVDYSNVNYQTGIVDYVLDETQVDIYIANNGYLLNTSNTSSLNESQVEDMIFDDDNTKNMSTTGTINITNAPLYIDGLIICTYTNITETGTIITRNRTRAIDAGCSI